MNSNQDWYLKNIITTIRDTDTDSTIGLSTKVAQQRLNEFGPNKLQSNTKKSILKIFFSQLNDTLIYVLLVAVLITIFMGEYMDGIIILSVVFINAILGVVQEVKAGNAIEALKNMATPKALVIRDGQQMEISSEEIVIGDILVLDTGRYVAADVRLIESNNLQIEEAALTGESVAVNKNALQEIADPNTPLGDRVNMAYMSTLVTYGRGLGVVVATAQNTEVGSIAKMLQQEEKVQTPLEIRLSELGKTIGKIAIGICLLMFLIGFLQGRNVVEMFLTAVSLAVASIPEGLAAIVAIVLSIGVTKMAQQNAIIKKLPAVETLGSVNVVCSDKTGTLTQNKMVVTNCFTFGDTTQQVNERMNVSGDLLMLTKAMVLSSDATLVNGVSIGDPTEIALLVLADNLNQDREDFALQSPRIDERAFDSNRKMMSTFHKEEDTYVVYTKGAVDALIAKCKYVLENGEIIPLTETHYVSLLRAADAMTENALRTLAAAYKPSSKILNQKDFEKDLILIGLVGMMDPPRVEVKDTIRLAKDAGITTIMITGDHKNTAFAIAKELGIATNFEQTIGGVELDKLSETELQDHIQEFRVFARVSPQHKVQIVKAFKSKGHIVSMTGDGVNDAPSLQAADIGVAMGIGGTDVAKHASDMILADDNFGTIIKAIEQGRNIYNNIKKSVLFLLSSNVGEVIAMLSALLLGMPIPLLAAQLLWINLITDTLPALALGMGESSKDVMQEQPRSAKESFFAKGAVGTIALGGILIGLVTIISFYGAFAMHGFSPFDEDIPETVTDYARTMAFMTIIACQLFYALSFVHPKKSIFRSNIFQNPYLILAIFLGFGLQLIVLYIPFMQEAFHLQALHYQSWFTVFLLGLIPLAANEVMKLLKR